MVTTRRGTANAEPATAGMAQSQSISKANDTVHVLIPITKRVKQASLQRKIPSTPPRIAISSTSSEYDLSLTSPSTGEVPKRLAMSTPKKEHDSVDIGERTACSALRTLAPKPLATLSGSCQNPIIVEETASPPRRAVRAPKRKPRHKKLTEPHQFIGNGYKDLYSYHASGSALEAMPANGSTFTGHQSHDIYRMMNAKMTAVPNFSPNAAWGRHTLNVPFEVQYPLSAQVLTQQRNASQHQSPYVQNHQAQCLPETRVYPIVPSQNEDLLRGRAVHYIREYSRHSTQKWWLSEADPEATSGGVIKGHQEYTRPQPNASTPQLRSMPSSAIRNIHRHINHEPTTHRDRDPDFLVGHLIEHTSLITSLLQLYPHSTDRNGLRHDISVMVQIQNQYVADWMKVESLDSRKRRKIDSSSSVSLDDRPQLITTPTNRIQNEKDNTLRQVLSANADMWQDGTGHGVADAFAAMPASSPVAGSFNRGIADSVHMPSISMAHSLPIIQEKSGTTGSAITTSMKQIPVSNAVSAHRKGLSVTEEIWAKCGGPSISPKDHTKSSTASNHSSSPSKDPEAHNSVASYPVTSHIEHSPNPMHSRSPAHSNYRKRSKPATIQHQAPSSDDDGIYVPNNINVCSESSKVSRHQRPVFRFEPRANAVSGQAGANPLSKE